MNMNITQNSRSMDLNHWQQKSLKFEPHYLVCHDKIAPYKTFSPVPLGAAENAAVPRPMEFYIQCICWSGAEPRGSARCFMLPQHCLYVHDLHLHENCMENISTIWENEGLSPAWLCGLGNSLLRVS